MLFADYKANLMNFLIINGLACLLMISSCIAMEQKAARIVNDTNKAYFVQMKRMGDTNNDKQYLCRSIYWLCLDHFSYEIHRYFVENSLQTQWYKHVTTLDKNTAYRFTIRPKHSLSIKVFANCRMLAEKLYSFESLPHAIKLSALLAAKDLSLRSHESGGISNGGSLRIVEPRQDSPRLAQKPLNKSRL